MPCRAGPGSYLAVQLLVQLTDALGQLGQLLGDDSMVDSLSGVRLHIEALGQEIGVALCKHSSSDHSVRSHLGQFALFLKIRLAVCNSVKNTSQ